MRKYSLSTTKLLQIHTQDFLLRMLSTCADMKAKLGKEWSERYANGSTVDRAGT